MRTIADDDIVRLLSESLEPRLSVGRRVHSIAGLFDDADDQCAQVVVVIDHEDARALPDFGRIHAVAVPPS